MRRTHPRIRAGLVDLFGGMRPKDAVSQAALHDRFFSHATERVLSPRIVLVMEAT